MKLLLPIRRHRYELIALLTGAVVMMLEVVGARLIAPYFGSSTYVWTAMIGVILGAMSLGFWYGGKLADRDQPNKDLSAIISGAAVCVLAMALLQEPVLELISRQNLDLRISAVAAAITLFGAPSMLIGMVSPHLAKIRVTSLKTTGAAVGRLEAAGAIGSIAGTFISGYFLLAYFGARNVTICLGIILILTSFLANRRRWLVFRLALAVVAVAMLMIKMPTIGTLLDIDSAYSRYQVQEVSYNSRRARFLVTDRQSVQSAVYVDDPTEPALHYIRAMFDVALSHQSPQSILVIGGGAHTLPTALQAHLPTSSIDVVEIDPVLDKIAKDYFGFTPAQNTRIIHQDGRSYLNHNSTKYDLVYLDAFSSLTPPFHLSSSEAAHRIVDSLSEQGVAVINVPHDYWGEFLPSLGHTYRATFKEVKLFQTQPNLPLDRKQNFLILASQNGIALEVASKTLGNELNFPFGGFILTDNYAPVERLSF